MTTLRSSVEARAEALGYSIRLEDGDRPWVVVRPLRVDRRFDGLGEAAAFLGEEENASMVTLDELIALLPDARGLGAARAA